MKKIEVEDAEERKPKEKAKPKKKSKKVGGGKSENIKLNDRVQNVVAIVERKIDFQPEEVKSYQAGTFRALYDSFLKEEKSKGVSHKEAMDLWKKSKVREELLATLSESERKKRRFV